MKGVQLKSYCLEVRGDFACFTRPEKKVERVSYDVITPSAARAVFEAILWKPAIRWLEPCPCKQRNLLRLSRLANKSRLTPIWHTGFRINGAQCICLAKKTHTVILQTAKNGDFAWLQ